MPITQSVKLRRGSKVKIVSDAPVQKLTLKYKRTGREVVMWIGRRNGKEKIFKTEAEARDFASASG